MPLILFIAGKSDAPFLFEMSLAVADWLLAGAGTAHLWFFGALIQATAAFGLLHGYLHEKSILRASCAVLVSGTILGTYLGIPQDFWWFSVLLRNGFVFGLFYFSLGVYTAHLRELPPLRRCVMGLALSLIALFSEGALIYVFKDDFRNDMLLFSIPVIFFLLCCLLWAERADVPGIIARNAVKLRTYSVLVYGWHGLIVVAFCLFSPSLAGRGGIRFFAYTLIISVALSVATLSLEKRLRWLRYLH